MTLDRTVGPGDYRWVYESSYSSGSYDSWRKYY